MIVDYINLKKKEDEVKAKKNELRDQILELMGNETDYENGYAKVSITAKENFKYTDEVAMISFLEKNGYDNFVIKTIDTAINKKLKEDPESLSELKPYYIKTVTPNLTVKEL